LALACFTRADGSSPPQRLTQGSTVRYPWSFTPDGKRLAFSELAGNRQLWTMPIGEEGGQLKAGTPERFLQSSFNDVTPSLSPDGRWIAYGSNESGTNEVYVRAFPPPPASGPGSKWLISNSGGVNPRWSRRGPDLFYQSGDRIMAVRYKVSVATFVTEKPRVWLAKLGAIPVGISSGWDVAPDGDRVAVLTPVRSTEPEQPDHEIVFVMNFFDELRRRLPLDE
jgi:hypothetical protein